MNARDLMTPNPAFALPDETIPVVADRMRTLDVGMLPVVDSALTRRLVGIITDRDIVTRAVAPGHGPSAKVHEHMSRAPLISVLPSTTVAELAERMQQYQIRRVPVIDAGGRVIGVVALADLARAVKTVNPLLVEQTLASVSRAGALVQQA